MRKYFAAEGAPFSDEEAERIGPELERIARERGVEPAEIVSVALDPSSPLHEHFDWNDDEAARKWRKQQARKMASSIMVRVKDRRGGFRTVRAFYSIQVEDRSSSGEVSKRRVYVTVGDVKEQPEMGEQVIQEALDSLLTWRDRYEDYRETFPTFGDRFESVFDAIERSKEDAA